MIFFLSNAIETQLISTGAFEIYLNGELNFPKNPQLSQLSKLVDHFDSSRYSHLVQAAERSSAARERTGPDSRHELQLWLGQAWCFWKRSGQLQSWHEVLRSQTPLQPSSPKVLLHKWPQTLTHWLVYQTNKLVRSFAWHFPLQTCSFFVSNAAKQDSFLTAFS